MGCHSDAEVTTLSVESIREAAGIERPIIPEDMYGDVVYDKWGNTILANGSRTKGPLFHDESVQKIMSHHPDWEMMFVEYVKYPRTYHLPWSEGVTRNARSYDAYGPARDWEEYQRWCGAGTKSPQYGTSAREQIAERRRPKGHGRAGWRRIHILNDPNILEIK